MPSNCIISQVHIPPHDVQGGLPGDHKKALVEFGLEHLRNYNPESYIILCGHGIKPDSHYLDLCDHVYWNTTHEPLNEYGYVIGMPAQFKYVSVGMEHAIGKGFKRVLKTRGDSIITRKNILNYYEGILQSEDKNLLITQQTGDDRMGDCFMYGDLEMLNTIWHYTNPVHDPDGLVNTAINFRASVNDQATPWRALLRRHCAFRDIDEMHCVCLRWNYYKLGQLDQATRSSLIDGTCNLDGLYWGMANGWHVRRGDQLSMQTGYLWSKRDFYQ